MTIKITTQYPKLHSGTLLMACEVYSFEQLIMEFRLCWSLSVVSLCTVPAMS